MFTVSQIGFVVLPPNGFMPHRVSTPRPKRTHICSLASRTFDSARRPTRIIRAPGIGIMSVEKRSRTLSKDRVSHDAMPHERHNPVVTASSRTTQAAVKRSRPASGERPIRDRSGLCRNTTSGVSARSSTDFSMASLSRPGSRECSVRRKPGKNPTFVDTVNSDNRSFAIHAKVRWDVNPR